MTGEHLKVSIETNDDYTVALNVSTSRTNIATNSIPKEEAAKILEEAFRELGFFVEFY